MGAGINAAGHTDGSVYGRKTNMEVENMSVISMKQLLEAGVH
ncbi:MAG TPA: 30S ribosomal protein S2, partial [Lachnospiraceae bacterium]|nr:30S ribosomal protein S2 [Lachnospiraceae bacterium]